MFRDLILLLCPVMNCNSGETPRQFPNGAHIKVTSYDTLRNQLAAILIFIYLFTLIIYLFITKIYSVINIIFTFYNFTHRFDNK